MGEVEVKDAIGSEMWKCPTCAKYRHTFQNTCDMCGYIKKEVKMRVCINCYKEDCVCGIGWVQYDYKKDEVDNIVDEHEKMISILSKDLFTICKASYEIIIKASISASDSEEVAIHLKACLAVIEKLSKKEQNESTG